MITNDLAQTGLIKRRIVGLPPSGYVRSLIVGNFYRVLNGFVQPRKLGYVLVGKAGIYVQRNPDIIRGVDVAFISHSRMVQVESATYLDMAPELVVEILSLGDHWAEFSDRLSEYFKIGVQLVWIAHPQRQQLHVYHSVTDTEILTTADELSGGQVLPDFKVMVAELFAE